MGKAGEVDDAKGPGSPTLSVLAFPPIEHTTLPFHVTLSHESIACASLIGTAVFDPFFKLVSPADSDTSPMAEYVQSEWALLPTHKLYARDSDMVSSNSTTLSAHCLLYLRNSVCPYAMSEIVIPRVQRAYILPALGVPLKLVNDHPVPLPQDLLPGQCLVKLTHSGVCHSDFAIKEGWFAKSTPPKPNLIGGHEGVGIIVAIGKHTHGSPVEIGDRVGISFMSNTCLNCEQCLDGDESYCAQMKKSGCSVDGTFSEFTVAYVEHVTPIPEALGSADAAPFMCAGFTVYNALKQCGARVGNWVAIPGAGGGLGHLGVQYAVAMGLRVVAIDSGEDKRKLTLELGAEKWIDYREAQDVVSEVVTATEGGAHAVIITTGDNTVYSQAIRYLRTRGNLVVVGLPRDGILSIPVLLLAARGITVHGVFIGNRQSAIEAVKLAAMGKVKCRYTLRGLSELEQVYHEMDGNKIVGRVVLDISK